MAIALAGTVVGGALGAWPTLERRLPAPARVTLGTRIPARDVPLSVWVAERAASDARRQLSLCHPDGVLTLARGDLGLLLDTASVERSLARPDPPLSVASRLRIWLGAPPPEPRRVEPQFRLDAVRASRLLAELAAGLHVDPADARLDLPGHARIEAKTGRELDIATSLARLAALGDRDELELAFRELRPTIPTDALAAVDPSLVLSEYETDFAHHGGPRIKNIARAAQYLDGTLMAPGEVWSFNHTVGPRTLERGFIEAPVIVADELEPGVGGGTCQVATTLFAASVLGGLDVVKRRSHSRPSGYAPLGLDATVIDGEVDLQLRNPYPVPVIVHAFLPVPTRVRVEMLGLVPPGKTQHTYAVTKSEDFFRRIARHPELLPDQVKRKQKGIPGYDVVSTVRTLFPDGTERVRHYNSTYYPVPEIFWIGRDVSTDTLPPLPERATHIEFEDAGGEAGTAPAPVSPASFSQ